MTIDVEGDNLKYLQSIYFHQLKLFTVKLSLPASARIVVPEWQKHVLYMNLH